MKNTIDELYDLLVQSDLHNNQLKSCLKQKIIEMGVPRFVREIATPLSEKVGNKWEEKEITLFMEHFYTSQMNAVLNDFILQNGSTNRCEMPKILVCTTVGETHLLGCTLVQALLCDRGAVCINLGTELPIVEIIRATEYYQPSVLGLSFSSVFNKRLMVAVINQIREKLSPNVELWVGGQGIKNISVTSNAKVLIDVDEILEAYDCLLKKI